ncbi:hypothetical protein RB595_009751 [Gaeumannomyces hyphopodioides]
MRPKSLPVDLGCLPEYVCRACLALRKPVLNLPAPRYYSRAARTARAPPGLARKTQHVQQAQQVQIPRVEIPEPETDDGNNVTFRYFEMDRPGHLRPLKDNAEFVASLESEERRAQAELDKMEAQLKLSAFKGLRELAERFGLVPKQAEKEAQEEPADYKPFKYSVDTTGIYTLHARPIIQLNWHLKRAAKRLAQGKIRRKNIHDTWKLYSLARPLLQNSWQRIPPKIWQLLWRLLSWDGPENTNRMGRVYQLGKDMRAAGVPIDDTSQVLLIEATFVEGPRKEALEAWKRFSLLPEHSSELREEYLKLGVRMHSMQGDLERAGRALDKLLETPLRSDPRFMLTFIRACAQDKTRLDKAWETYRLMRGLLGTDIKIEDYDEVVASFLLLKQTELAFKVFVDMMFSGTIDLHGKTKLPSAVGSHFFMGKWLKRLIGAGNLDGALEVLKFMQTKGILAAKVQVNGLIGAWLRSGLAENIEKADKLAWAMVRSRLAFVELRRREALVDWPIRLLQTPNKTEDLPDALGLTFVPQASLETFSLMAENYKERRLHSKLEGLWVAFQKCEMSTDAFMMNQLLESYNQEGLGVKAREVYKALTEEHALTPDAYTFFALYRSLEINLRYWGSVTDETMREEVQICRELFRDMVGSSWAFEAEEVQQALMRIVLHSFRKCGDNVGVIVSLRAMRDVFDRLPGHAISMEMLAENPDVAQSKKKLFEVSRKVQAAYDISLKGGGDATPTRRELSQQEGAEILVRMVEEYYLQKIGPTSDEELELMYQTAILEMGLADVLIPSQAPDEGGQEEEGVGSALSGAAGPC